ncbi:hypothetical protein F4780DRAFT_274274 [Xylariomycetidae sp. FL0641]|nr:hypothetical protein F4780DRAFT_274274 [Xylariomycetidae sp. FL0641]
MSSSNLPIPILQPFPEPGATYLLELWARISRQLAYAFIIPEFEPNGSRPPSPQQHSSPTLPHSEELFPQAPPTSPGSSHSWQSSSEKAFSRSQSAASPNTEHTQSSAADSEHPDSDHSDESANYIPNEYWRDGPDSPIFKAMFAALSWAKGCPHIDLNLEDFRTLAHSTAGVVEAFLSPHKNINRDPPQLRTFDLTPVYPPYLPWRVLVSGSNEMTECLYILWGQPSMRLAHSANLLSVGASLYTPHSAQKARADQS